MRALSPDEISRYEDWLVPLSESSPVQFMDRGWPVNIRTGERVSPARPMPEQPAYWHFTREVAVEIAGLTGTRAQFLR